MHEFLRFCLICEISLTVDNYNMDDHLESSWCLVYYQVSGEPGIAGCSRQLLGVVVDRTFTLWGGVWTCAQAYSLIISTY